MRNSLKALLTILAIVVASTLLSGCGGDSSDSGSSEINTTKQDGIENSNPSGQFDWNQSEESPEERIEDPFDADGDGIPDFADVDAGGDGFASGTPSGEMSPAFDPDGDGIPNAADWDKDGDGIPD